MSETITTTVPASPSLHSLLRTPRVAHAESPYRPQTAAGERLISSTIIKEELLGEQHEQDRVTYIEVPVVEEVVRRVPKKEVVEVEKRVPRYETQWVDKIVEVPQIHYVDKHVEVPQIKEILKEVPTKRVVDMPREVIKYVPKIETRVVEKIVEVPGEVIEVSKPYIVENKVVVPKFIDQEQPCIVAQSLYPIISESDTEVVEVEMREFNPYLVPVDVMVPRPVSRQLVATKKVDEHRIVDIPAAHFNALLRRANPTLSHQDLEELYVVSAGSTVHVANDVAYVPVNLPQDFNRGKASKKRGASKMEEEVHVRHSHGLSTFPKAVEPEEVVSVQAPEETPHSSEHN